MKADLKSKKQSKTKNHKNQKTKAKQHNNKKTPNNSVSPRPNPTGNLIFSLKHK